jgi:hypothetical protein
MPIAMKALTERYAQHAIAMANAMQEAGEHIEANSYLDLSPTELISAIDDIAQMLLMARYHAERMNVYGRLIASTK